MESLWLIILFVVILILVFPLTFDIKFNFDVKNNKGSFSIRLWLIKIFVAKIKIKGREIAYQTKFNRGAKEVTLTAPQLRFIDFFNKEVKNKVKIREIHAFSRIGVGNPCGSALVSAAFEDTVLIVFSRIKIKSPTAEIWLKSSTNFYASTFIFGAHIRASLSIFDVLYSFIISVLKSKKSMFAELKL